MTKDEVIALGVPENRYRAFQEAYNRDVNKAASKKRTEDTAGQDTRAAILATLKLVKKRETLERILRHVYRAYCEEV